jgi:hypothetical protein
MQFFYDTEFLEDGERIWPISIGMVTPEGREFYRVYADTLCSSKARDKIRAHRFVMSEVVPHLPQLAQQAIYGRDVPPGDTFNSHPIIAPRWRIALELADFISAAGDSRDQHELWAYYGAYDHVVLSQTFGTMMQLPASVPMFTRDLMQMEAAVNRQRAANGLPPVERPAKQGDEHYALADARWNWEFRQVLGAADLGGCPETTVLAWTIDRERDLVTVPSRVFLAGYECLTAKGPNEGLDPDDEQPAGLLWNALL